MKSKLYALTLSALAAGTLIGCGGSDDNAGPIVTSIPPVGSAFVQELDKIGDTQTATIATRRSSKFEFPSLETADGATKMTVPAGALPSFSARRTLSRGNGTVVGYGDSVSLQYDMFSWATGILVESTTLDGGDLGVTIEDNSGVPTYLMDSLLGKKRGDTIQVVFKPGMEDLPDYLNADDAYILIIKII